MTCEWGDANHTYFQIANLFLAFTYFVPNTIKGLLMLRFFLGTAGFFFCLWSGIIICSPDTLTWNLVFLAGNFGHASYLLYQMRPINFDDDNEIVYSSLFEPLGIKRWQYAPLAKISTVKELSNQDVIAIEHVTLGESVSILTSGSICVEKNKKFLNRLKPYEFIDSPEWITSTQSGGAMPVVYEVSLISEGCVTIQWKRKTLLKLLRTSAFLKNVFDSLIGRDVAGKLFKSQNTLMQHISTGSKDKRKTSIFYRISDEIKEHTRKKGVIEVNEQTMVLQNNDQPKYGGTDNMLAVI